MTTIIATFDYLAADKRSTYSHGAAEEALVVDKIVPLIDNKVYMVVAGSIEMSRFIEAKKCFIDELLPLIKEKDIIKIVDTLRLAGGLPLFKSADVLIYAKEFGVMIKKNGAVSVLDPCGYDDYKPTAKYTILGSGSNVAVTGLRLGLPVEKIFEITGKIDASTSTEFDIVYRAEMKSFFEEQPIAE